MRPAVLALVLLAGVAATGCGGGRSAPPAAPSPAPAPPPPAPADPGPRAPASAAADSVRVPKAPLIDPAPIPPAPLIWTIIPRETDDDARIAADSAADEAALDRLAAAGPGADDAAEEAADSLDAAGDAAEGAKALTGAVTWDIDVTTFTNHARVQYYLDFFRETGHDAMGVWLTRLGRYEGMIRERLQREGLPGDLVYLALIESGLSNTATSPARAVGMWQFVKGTARLYGLRVDSWVDERRDPFRATDAAARHLRDLRERFGSLYLAAAAYNAGAGRVSRGLGRLPEEEGDSLNSDATFFRLYDTKLLRRETKDYVPKLIAAALVAKAPERYGFSPVEPEPIAYDSIIVPAMTGLDVVARLADTTLAAIRELNPQYLRLATPPGESAVVRLPVGRGPATVAAYAELPPKQRVTVIEHRVARGETLGGIARRYGVSQRVLADANPQARRRLRIGQRLVVPTGGAFSVSVARRMAAPAGAAARGPWHRVRRGETVSEIAREYGVRQRDLLAWNGLADARRIRAGQRLRVAPPRLASTAGVGTRRARGGAAALGEVAKAPRPMRTHVVRPGETLSGLAQRYGVSVQALRRANGMSRRQALRAGVALRIPG